MRTSRAAVAAALAVIAAAGVVIGCGTGAESTPAGTIAATAPASVAAPSSLAALSAPPSTVSTGPLAADTLAALPVKGRAPKTGYDRDQFGPAWADVDRNGCDTRNDVLARDLTGVSFRAGSACVVASGVLADPYTGRSIMFTRGQGTSDDVQIDHVVSLSDAWQKGAQQLDTQRRRELANDPLNLMATDGPTNQRKGDGDAATWLPPNTSFRCDYVARQVAVKAKYGLWITAAEHDAIAGILDGCPGERLPA